MIDIAKIDRLEEIFREEARLLKERESIAREAEYSTDNLRVVYAATRAYALEKEFGVSKMRECFLFVALYIFDPESIVRKMRKGLRKDLADVLAVSENNVSHLTKHLLFRYRHYKEFRSDVNDVYEESVRIMRT